MEQDPIQSPQEGYYNGGGLYLQLKKLRLYRGYKSQAALCEELGISRQVYNMWELGKRNPSLPQLTMLANTLKICISYFFIKEGDPEDFCLKTEVETIPESQEVTPEPPSCQFKFWKRIQEINRE